VCVYSHKLREDVFISEVTCHKTLEQIIITWYQRSEFLFRCTDVFMNGMNDKIHMLKYYSSRHCVCAQPSLLFNGYRQLIIIPRG